MTGWLRAAGALALAAAAGCAPLGRAAPAPAAEAAATTWADPASRAATSDTIDLASLLREMVDRDVLARFPEPRYRALQASSYDRNSVASDQPGWFANVDRGNYVREEERDGRREYVLMDAHGPGAVVRIWSANAPIAGTLRVYLDGAEEPVLEGPAAEVLGGKGPVGPPLAAVRGRGFNFYLPIPFARRCVITVDRSPDRGIYYLVNYRLYPEGTPVRSFGSGALAAAGDELARVQRALSEPASPPPGRRLTLRRTLAPGERAEVALPAGPAAVRTLSLRVEGGHPERTLRSTILRVRFDGQETVWAPVGDFFGSGVGLNPHQGWWSAVAEEGVMRAHWVMPYRADAVVALENVGSDPVSAALDVGVDGWRWDARSMHFHAGWRRERLATEPRRDWNYVEVQGSGVYVGDVLAVHNPVEPWWGEGDERIRVDGEVFPSHFGTGTEDYYGYAWCSNERFSAPFHAQPRNDQERHTRQMCRHSRGHITNLRTRALDAIPFERSLRLDMELWHWDERTEVDYAATTFWYALPGGRHNRGPAPAAAARPAPSGPRPAYVMAYFRSGPSTQDRTEKLHLAYSRDGLRWWELNRNQEVWAPSSGFVRDPFVKKGPDGRFHVVYTVERSGHEIGYVHSRDLVTFEGERRLPVMADVPGTANAWAPEWSWDADSSKYMVYWASSVGTGGRPNANTHYYAYTADWRTLGPVRPLFEPGYSAIDASIVSHDGVHRLFYKDESGVFDRTKPPTATRMARSKRLNGGYGQAGALITPSYTEGAEVLRLEDRPVWYLYYDYWKEGRFGVMRSGDLEQWSEELPPDSVRFPFQRRHASFLPVAEAELWRLLEAWSLVAHQGGERDAPVQFGADAAAGGLHEPFALRSVSLRLRSDEPGSTQVLYDEGGAGGGLALRLRGDTLEAAVRADGQVTAVATPLGAVGVWRHAVVTFAEGALRLYLDGMLAASAQAPFQAVGPHPDAAGLGARFGSDAFGDAGDGAPFRGATRDVRIYSVPLQQEDVHYLHARPE